MMYTSSFLRFRRKWQCGLMLLPQRVRVQENIAVLKVILYRHIETLMFYTSKNDGDDNWLNNNNKRCV